MDPFSYICVLTSIVAGPHSYPAGERVRPASPDPRPHADLLGAHALDGERAFDNDHHVVGAIPLAQRPALDAVLVFVVARRAADSLSRMPSSACKTQCSHSDLPYSCTCSSYLTHERR